MGEVIPIEAAYSVQYEGRALQVLTRLSHTAVRLAEASDIARNLEADEALEKSLELLGKIQDPMCAIEETMNLLDENVQYILSELQDDEPAQFINNSSIANLRVTTSMVRRCYTLRVGELRFRTAPKLLLPGNSQIVCQPIDGILVCQLMIPESASASLVRP